MVDEPIDSWSVLWDEKYKDNILMQDSVRDAFAVAIKIHRRLAQLHGFK